MRGRPASSRPRGGSWSGFEPDQAKIRHRAQDAIGRTRSQPHPKALPSFRWRPLRDSGIPILRESRAWAWERPMARRMEKEKPGMPLRRVMGAPGGGRWLWGLKGFVKIVHPLPLRSGYHRRSWPLFFRRPARPGAPAAPGVFHDQFGKRTSWSLLFTAMTCGFAFVLVALFMAWSGDIGFRTWA